MSSPAARRALPRRSAKAPAFAIGPTSARPRWSGRDRASFLQGMLSNDVKGARARPGLRGRVSRRPWQGDGAVARCTRSPTACCSSCRLGSPRRPCSPSTSTSSRKRSPSNRWTRRYAVLSLQGPQAPALLEGLAGGSLDAAPHAHAELTLAGITGARVIQRLEFGALPGFFLWVAPRTPGAARAPARGRRGAVGDEAAEVLRVESGEPVFGIDVDDGVAAGARPRGPHQLYQGLLHRPGARGAREVPRARQPRAGRAAPRGRDRTRPGSAR